MRFLSLSFFLFYKKPLIFNVCKCPVGLCGKFPKPPLVHAIVFGHNPFKSLCSSWVRAEFAGFLLSMPKRMSRTEHNLIANISCRSIDSGLHLIGYQEGHTKQRPIRANNSYTQVLKAGFDSRRLHHKFICNPSETHIKSHDSYTVIVTD